MIDDYMLNKILNKSKEIISTEKFDDIKILIDTNDKLPDWCIPEDEKKVIEPFFIDEK